MKIANMAGKQYGRWTVLNFSGAYSRSGTRKRTFWKCRCSCGQKRDVDGGNLRAGLSVSCGCFKIEQTKLLKRKHFINGRHYNSHDKTYSCWCVLKRRCTDKNFIGYSDYGGRGITFCERWKKFENFLADMGDKPKGMTIERIDNDGDYEPLNCKWATIEEQNNNTSQCVFIEKDGLRLTISQWAKKLGMRYLTLYGRIKYYKWSIERAFTVPVRSQKRNSKEL